MLCACSQASLSADVHVFRMRTVEAFLASGTPMNRLNFFRPVIERAGYSITDVSHMRSYIPKVEAFEFAELKREVHNEFLSVSFDGTSRLGEAVNITGKWCDTDFWLRCRLLRFLTAKNHLKAANIATLLTRALCTDLGFDPAFVVSMSRDSAAVNGAASRLLAESPFNATEKILCICHTLNNAGGQISMEPLATFTTAWLELVGGRHPHVGAKALWAQTVAPQRVPGFSNVRWFSKAEIQFVIAENFEKLLPFLAQLDEMKYGDSTRQRLHLVLDDAAKRRQLKTQLDALLDVRRLVRAT